VKKVAFRVGIITSSLAAFILAGGASWTKR
jgi:hypothetical protein